MQIAAEDAALVQKELTAAASRSKYGNQKDNREGISFDSKKEARRYDELMLLLRAGDIRKLRLQVDFTLQDAYTEPTGERVRAIRYRADFAYEEQTERGWSYVVEDVKSRATKTPTYKLKIKLMQERLGLSVREV